MEIALILLLLLVLQVSLGTLVGKCLHFGMSEEQPRRQTRRWSNKPKMPLVLRAAKYHGRF